jgi:hypothetical protein
VSVGVEVPSMPMAAPLPPSSPFWKVRPRITVWSTSLPDRIWTSSSPSITSGAPPGVPGTRSLWSGSSNAPSSSSLALHTWPSASVITSPGPELSNAVCR